jgi:hypothetical protein
MSQLYLVCRLLDIILLHRFLIQTNHPSLRSSAVTMSRVVSEIRDDFDVNRDGVISKLGQMCLFFYVATIPTDFLSSYIVLEFLCYYTHRSSLISKDLDFEKFVFARWGFPLDGPKVSDQERTSK